MATAAVIGGGLVMGAIGADRQAKAATKAGHAREAAAAAQLRQAKESQQMAIKAAEAGPQELAALERSIQQQERGVAREEKFLGSIDPTLIEASQQALKLLRGEESSSLAPMKAQRDRQRKALVDQLRSQLGPGAETSSAGIQALTQFDQQTSMGLAQQQQASLGQLLGSTQQSASQGRSSLANLGQQGLGIAGGFSNIKARGVNAITGSQAGMSAAGSAMTNAAGARYSGDQLRGQAISGIGGQLVGAGVTAGLSGLGGSKKVDTENDVGIF